MTAGNLRGASDQGEPASRRACSCICRAGGRRDAVAASLGLADKREECPAVAAPAAETGDHASMTRYARNRLT